MVYYIKAAARFLILLFLLFLFFMVSIFVFNILPVSAGRITEVELKILAQALFLPAFYISFVNASLVALFVYSFLIVDYQHIHRFIVRFIPFLIALAMFCVVTVYMRPDKGDLVIEDVKDARFYIEEGVFFNYKNDLPVILSDSRFNSLYKDGSQDEKRLLKKGYIKKSYEENYSLNTSAGYIHLELLKNMFTKKSVIEDIKVYFGRVDKNSVGDVIISDKTDVYHIKNGTVSFSGNKAFVTFDSDSYRELCFSRKIFMANDESRQFVIYKLIKNNVDIISLFFSGKMENNIVLWAALSYLLLTFASLVYNHNFPFISIIFNLISLIVIFYFMSDIYDLIRWVFKNLVPPKIAEYKYQIVGLSLFVPAFLFNVIRGMLHRAEKAESDGRI